MCPQRSDRVYSSNDKLRFGVFPDRFQVFFCLEYVHNEDRRDLCVCLSTVVIILCARERERPVCVLKASIVFFSKENTESSRRQTGLLAYLRRHRGHCHEGVCMRLSPRRGASESCAWEDIPWDLSRLVLVVSA